MKETTLRSHYNKIKFVECIDFDTTPIKEFPASPGYLIIELIKKYKIPFKELGYYHNIVSIKTKKQALLWRDTGIGATFLGLINLESGKVEIKKEEWAKPKTPFNSMAELTKEIQKRDYQKIKGLKANITHKDYMYFLEVLPPKEMKDNYFIMPEALSDNLYYKFFENGRAYSCEVVAVEE